MTISRTLYFFMLSMLCLFTTVWLSSCSPEIENLQGTSEVKVQFSSDAPFDPTFSDWPHSTSDITPDPRVKFGRLENGLRYAILPVVDENGVVSIQMNISVGFYDEPKGKYGIAHLLEHMAFRGARGDTGNSIIHDLQSEGVGYGSDLNGYTQHENTFYRINLASASSDKIDLALNSFERLVQNLELTEASLVSEKKIVMAELKLRDAAEARAREDERKFRYPDRSREKSPGIGTPETLEGITLADVKSFYKEHYRPENAFLIITGDVNQRRTENRISKLFSDWSVETKTKPNKIALKDIDIETFPTIQHYQEKSLKTELRALENTASTQQNDTLSFRNKQFAENMVFSMMRTRLKPKIEASSEVSWINIYKSRHDGYDIREVGLSAKNYKSAMVYFEEERLRVLKYGFMPRELAFALDKEEDYLNQLNENSVFLNAWLEANRLRNTFTRGEVYLSSSQKLEQFEDFSNSLTKEAYHNAARDIWEGFEPRYWTKSSRSMEQNILDVKAVRKDLKQTEITPPVELEKDRFELPSFEEKGQIVSRDIITREKVHTVLYDNGTRLNYKPTTKEDDDITIAVAIKTSFSDISKLYGFFAERVALLTRADISGASKSGMDRKFLGQKADFNVSMVGKDIVISTSTRPRDLQASLRMITAFVTDVDISANHHKEMFENQQSRTRTASKNSPVLAGILTIPYSYSNGSSAFRSNAAGSYYSFKHLGEAIEIEILYSPIEVGVVGDFDPSTLEAVFASTLGAVPSRERMPVKEETEESDISFIDPGVTTLTYAGTDKQMALFYCWPGTLNNYDKNGSVSDLAVQIFNNRIVEKFRQELAVTYSPQIVRQANPAFPEFKYICFAIQFDPKHEALIHRNFNDTIEKFSSELVSKTELKRAREPIVSLLERYGNSNQLSALPVALSYSDPKLFTEFTEALPKLKDVRLSDINQYFIKNFNKSRLHIFRIQHKELGSAIVRKTLQVKANNGDVDGQFELGMDFAKKWTGDVNIKKSLLWLEKAAAQGHKQANYELGRKMAINQKDLKKAENYLRLSEDNKEGSFLLAEMYFKNPEMFPEISEKQIMDLYRLSAENGSDNAQQALAQRLKDGSITARDEKEALKWILTAYFLQHGDLANTDSNFIQKYSKNLSVIEQESAREDAADWVEAYRARSSE